MDQDAPESTSVSWGSGLPNTDHRTYVCFGVTRGGTSAVAGAMRRLGVFMGDNLLNNHEDPEMKIDGHLDVVGGAYNLHRLKMIEKRNETHKVWGWKDPDAITYLYELTPYLINPHYVIVGRDPVATAKAHMRWYLRDPRFAIGDIVLQHQRNVMFSLSCDAPVLFVSYEKALLYPQSFIEELAAFLGVPPPQDEQSLVAFLAHVPGPDGSYKD